VKNPITHRLSDAQKGVMREEILELLDAGVSRAAIMQDLARKYGVQPRSIRYYVYEVAGRAPGGARFRNKFSANQRRAVRADILALLGSGIRRSAVAAQLAPKYSVHATSIWYYIRQVAGRSSPAPILSAQSAMEPPGVRKIVASAQEGVRPVRTIFVDGSRAELVLRRDGAERIIASLVFHDEGKLMNALQRSMDALPLMESRPQPPWHAAPPDAPTATGQRPPAPEPRAPMVSTALPVIKPRPVVSPEALLEDIRDACLSGVIPTNCWNGQCYVLPKVTFLVWPRAFHRLVERGLYTYDPRGEIRVYLEALEKLPCVQKRPGGHVLTAITMRPGGRPLSVVAIDTHGLFRDAKDLAKAGFWSNSPIRELSEAELGNVRAKEGVLTPMPEARGA
jgi:hypothetical protein